MGDLARLTPGLQADLIVRSFAEWCDNYAIPERFRADALRDILDRRVGSARDVGAGMSMLAVGYGEFRNAVNRAVEREREEKEGADGHMDS